ncbi:MAG: TrbI/VirB10 family protein [Verrucomicrobiae bacterium]|nr:TrbI/VirB10 family protein [Verrucomicrobiae bacterium]
MFPRILDFIKSPPGAMLCLVIVILISFQFVGEERSRSKAPDPVASLPTGDSLDTEELSTPQLVERKDSFTKYVPAAPKRERQPTISIEAAPEPTQDKHVAPRIEPVKTKPVVLVHSFSPVTKSPIAQTDAPSSSQNPETLKRVDLPYGTLIPCRLIHSVEAGTHQSPLIGVVTEDVRAAGEVVVPEGTAIHGSAAGIVRDRLNAAPQWHFTINGKTSTITGSILSREIDPTTHRFTFGRSGLPGTRIDKPFKGTGRIFAATAISAVAHSIKDTSNGIFGAIPNNSLKNAGLEGGSAIADRHAEQLLDKTRDIKPVLSIAEGTEFYLYTQK